VKGSAAGEARSAAARTSPGLRRLAGLLALMTLAALGCASHASAELPDRYHEAARFGGLDESAFRFGEFGGPPTPGRFVEPTGFAVDPAGKEGKDVIYVADRTSSLQGVWSRTRKPCAEAGGEGEVCVTDWRIQELSATGTVLATTTFTLPAGRELPSEEHVAASTIAGLAVDHAAGRLYALVMGPLPEADAHHQHAVAAQELLAWSIAPAGCAGACGPAGGELKAPGGAGIRPDPLGSGGGLISSEAQLRAPTPLYDPQGIVVDRLEQGVDDPVAIEATNLRGSATANELVPTGEPFEYTEYEQLGDTVVQQVATSAAQTGERQASWSSAGFTLGTWGPRGIFDNPDGSISVLMKSSERRAANAYLARLGPNLKEARALVSDESETAAPTEASMFLDPGPFFTDPNRTPTGTRPNAPDELWGAGPQAAALSNGLFAADFYLPEPSNCGLPRYWHTEEIQCFPEQMGDANIGVRLLKAGANGLLSDPEGKTVVNTLGAEGSAGNRSACEIGAQEPSLAAGAGGSVWVFDRGPTTRKLAKSLSSGTETRPGRDIIQLAPGAASPQASCPQPSGTFAMGLGCEAPQPALEQLTVPAGVPVSFDASPVAYGPTKPYGYSWEFGDGTSSRARAETHVYTQPGEYAVHLGLWGDYGRYSTPAARVKVLAREEHVPLARFTVSAARGLQQVSVDASGSVAGTCNTVAAYRWTWGDGTAPEDERPQAPIVTHTYGRPGQYTVTLTVFSSAGAKAEDSQIVQVKAPEPTISEAPPEALGPTLTPPTVAQGPPPPPSVPADPPPHASFSRGLVRVTLSCPASKISCAGQVLVRTVAAFSSRARGSGAAKQRRSLLIGRASYSLAGGRHATLSLRLSVRGAALLARMRRLPVLVTVSARYAVGGTRTTTLHLILLATPHGHR